MQLYDSITKYASVQAKYSKSFNATFLGPSMSLHIIVQIIIYKIFSDILYSHP